MFRYSFLIALLAIITINGCDLVDRDEPLPAWIRIDSMSVVDNPNVDEGSLSHDISDAWVFIDEELIGIFELPADIPILDEGKHRLLIGAGIKVSTVSTVRDNYLFYNAHSQDITLTPGETTPLTPSITYRNEDSAYTYIVVEEFEDGFLDMEANTNTDATIRRTTEYPYVFEGSGSGLIEITDTTRSAWIRTSEDFNLPQLGKVVYLELDYYTEFDLVIGVHITNYGISDQNVNYLTLNADQGGEVKWKKAYIALTSVLAQAQNMQSAYIYLLPDFQTSSKTSGVVLIDNVKIMHQR